LNSKFAELANAIKLLLYIILNTYYTTWNQLFNYT